MPTESEPPRQCVSCNWYLFKAATGPLPAGEWGVCENPAVSHQTKITGLHFLSRVLDDANIAVATQEAIERELDIRVRGDFGCRHWEQQP